ncbi:hypothetical protein [uncultured Clostridium sp.]|nr:hypothetical protein [uncultured Clostridium sp.]
MKKACRPVNGREISAGLQKDFERDIGKHITEKCVPYNDWRNGHE